MCGIAGYTHRQRIVDTAVMRRITASLIHRGPDQQGTFESRNVSLGAVRLKIIDLSGGDQPLKSDDGNTVVVFNGEIYNHAELRRELESRGHVFHTRCDTEVALNAFLEWDLGCFSRFRGMFAIAFWSESRQAPCARPRPPGNQAPVFASPRPGRLFRLRIEGAFRPQRDSKRRLDTTGLHLFSCT